jgi:hypothetical protein
MCVLQSIFWPVQADYKSITDRYIESSTKITVYRSINLVGVSVEILSVAVRQFVTLGVVYLTLMHGSTVYLKFHMNLFDHSLQICHHLQ